MNKLPETFYYKRNILQILRGFFFAAQLNSISKAAKQIGLTQSTVSLQIKALERDLGIKLFHRHGPKIKLTEEGKSFYSMALPYVEGIDSLYENFHIAHSKEEKVTLNICASQAAMLRIIPHYIKSYKKNNPEISITIHAASIEEAFDLLQKNETHIAFYPEPIELLEIFDFHYLFESPYLLVVRKGHPLAKKKIVTFEEAQKYEMVRSDPKFVTVPLFEETIKSYNFANGVFFKNTADWEVLKRFVRHSDCFCFLPDIGIDKHDDSIVGISIPKKFPFVKYGCFTKKGRILPPQVKDLIDIAKATTLKKK